MDRAGRALLLATAAALFAACSPRVGSPDEGELSLCVSGDAEAAHDAEAGTGADVVRRLTGTVVRPRPGAVPLHGPCDAGPLDDGETLAFRDEEGRYWELRFLGRSLAGEELYPGFVLLRAGDAVEVEYLAVGRTDYEGGYAVSRPGEEGLGLVMAAEATVTEGPQRLRRGALPVIEPSDGYGPVYAEKCGQSQNRYLHVGGTSGRAFVGQGLHIDVGGERSHEADTLHVIAARHAVTWECPDVAPTRAAWLAYPD